MTEEHEPVDGGQRNATAAEQSPVMSEIDTPDAHLPAQKPAAAAETGRPLSTGSTPMDMIARHIANGGSFETLEKLFELERRWEANEARKAFFEAMAAFAADPPFITKNHRVDFENRNGPGRTTYDHATLDEIVHKTAERMGPVGLSFRWRTDNSQEPIAVTCIVSHRMGHFEEVTLYGPLDKSGNKNALQAIGSAVSYLQRYTLKASLGLAESGDDDDGLGSSGTRATPPASQDSSDNSGEISVDQAQQIRDALNEHDALSLNGYMLKLRRLMPDNRPPKSIESIPQAIYDSALEIAQGGR